MKILRTFAVAALCLGIFPLPVRAEPLPDTLNEWRATALHSTELNVASEDMGTWYSGTYSRSAPAASVEVNLMEGPGAGSLYIPDNGGRTNDAPLGFSSTYETLDIAGKRAILERGEVTGQALAVALDKNRTLTLESKSLNTEELLDFADRLVRTLQTK